MFLRQPRLSLVPAAGLGNVSAFPGGTSFEGVKGFGELRLDTVRGQEGPLAKVEPHWQWQARD